MQENKTSQTQTNLAETNIRRLCFVNTSWQHEHCKLQAGLPTSRSLPACQMCYGIHKMMLMFLCVSHMISAHNKEAILHVSTKTHKAPTLILSIAVAVAVAIAVAEVLVVKAIGVSEDPAVAPGQQQQQVQAGDQQGALKTQHDAVCRGKHSNQLYLFTKTPLELSGDNNKKQTKNYKIRM